MSARGHFAAKVRPHRGLPKYALLLPMSVRHTGSRLTQGTRRSGYAV
jgi:hypothetical protein